MFVRSLSGYGELAVLDPVSGALREVGTGSSAVTQLGGVFGDLGGVPVVLYRDGSGLMLRVGTQIVPTDEPGLHVEWHRVVMAPGGGVHARLTVSVRDEVMCVLRYPNLPADNDLGRFVRDVLADPQRRSRVFESREVL
ncbi:hypothetical protein ACQP1G_41695 [Nocardia sp. CA-107356]|uniref:hypothetical protein n=1 Tax=Nocardia sp. CA-107356 TaxID=3239972 RepID=UPI003D8B9646